MTIKNLTNFVEREKIKKSLKDLALGIAGAGITIGLGVSLSYVHQGLKKINEKIENTDYIKNLRKEQEEKREFQEKYLNAVKNHKVNYTHCGYNAPLWYIDIDGDKNPDGYLSHVVGSTRGAYCIGLYKIKKK